MCVSHVLPESPAYNLSAIRTLRFITTRMIYHKPLSRDLTIAVPQNKYYDPKPKGTISLEKKFITIIIIFRKDYGIYQHTNKKKNDHYSFIFFFHSMVQYRKRKSFNSRTSDQIFTVGILDRFGHLTAV